jgi:hypothetical protein
VKCPRCGTNKSSDRFEYKPNGRLNRRICKDCIGAATRAKRRAGLIPQPIRPDCYYIWQAMIRRCECPEATGYGNYGGRGIKVCERWRKSFANFTTDMGPRPSAKHSLDRYPDQNGDYEPGNCRWATVKEQQNNKRTNRLLSHNGRTQTMAQWAEEIGITIYALSERLKRGKMTLVEALTFQPPHIEYDGKKLSATDWAKVVGIKANTIAKRIKDGWTPEEALTTPVRNWGRPHR